MKPKTDSDADKDKSLLVMKIIPRMMSRVILRVKEETDNNNLPTETLR